MISLVLLLIAKASGLNVTAVSMDNFSANRKFYLELCGRKLRPSIENPVNKQQPLFLLFVLFTTSKIFITFFQKDTSLSFAHIHYRVSIQNENKKAAL